MKKIFALVLATLLVLSCFAALAEGGPSITITNTNNNISIAGKTYNAYKLFDSTKSGTAVAYTMSTSNQFYSAALLGTSEPSDDLAKLLWSNFTFTATEGDTTKVNVVAKAGFNATVARTFADDIQPFLSGKSATATGTASGETAVIDLSGANAGLGYYIVTGEAAPTSGTNPAGQTVVSAVILTNEDPNPVVKPKADAPGLNKKMTKVQEGSTEVQNALLDDKGKAAVAKVGSTVSYELTSAVPDLTGYDDYKYIMHDALTGGLDYVKSSFTLTIGEDTVNIDPVFAEGDKSFSLTIPYNTLKTYTKGTAIKLTYNCTVNDSALTTDYENNTANLEYSHSPYDQQTNHTPDQKTYVIDINIDVTKVAEDATGTKLKDAEFKLYRLNGTTKEYYKWDSDAKKATWVAEANADVLKTNEQGKLINQVKGLDKGTYYLVETKAPQGYNLLKDPIEITISVTEGNDGKVTYTATNASVTNGVVDLTAAQNTNQPVADATVINNGGTELPSTGGMGTTLFYVGGGILVLLAVVMLVTKKRMSGND